MSDHEVIYLEPICSDCGEPDWPDVGRQWCEDDVWAGERCEECGEKLPETPQYVLASRVALSLERLAELLPVDQAAEKRVADWLRRKGEDDAQRRLK